MKNLISNIRNGAAGGIILLFFSIQIVAIIGSLLFPDHFRYLNPANIAVLLKSMAPLGIMSLGVGILMISGEFDLSVGTLYTFCGIITASLVGGGLSVQGTGTESVYQMSPYLATLCGVLVGVMAGLGAGVGQYLHYYIGVGGRKLFENNFLARRKISLGSETC